MSDDKRSARRFPVQLPMSLKYSNGEVRRTTAEARNVSVGGIYFYSPAKLAMGDQIELVVPLPEELRAEGKAWLLCRGKVVRVESASEEGTGIGAVLEEYHVITDI